MFDNMALKVLVLIMAGMFCLQLSRIVYLFSRNVHDSSLPLSVQTTCVRLMLNLVSDCF
jgi:transformation/transcription domain-associated protein